MATKKTNHWRYKKKSVYIDGSRSIYSKFWDQIQFLYSIMINLTTWSNNKILCLFVYLVAWLLWQQPYQWRKSKPKEKPHGQGWRQQQDLHQKQYVAHQYSFALYIVIAYLNKVKVCVSSRGQFRSRYRAVIVIDDIDVSIKKSWDIHIDTEMWI